MTILAYYRPTTLTEALALLAQADPVTIPIGGGTAYKRDGDESFAVVDLQALGLNKLERKGKSNKIGATVTLQTLLDNPDLSEALGRAIQHEAGYNLRQMATVAGSLIACDGRAPFATALLALDAQLTLEPGGEGIGLGDLLPVRAGRLRHRLVTQVTLPGNARLAYEYVARTPADLPIVCVAVAQWPSGRTRVALGGYGAAPVLAMDGPEPAGADPAAQAAYSQAGDAWASAEYRAEMAGVLTRRAIDFLALTSKKQTG